MNKIESTRIMMRPGNRPTTLSILGDVGTILRASCVWKSPTSEGSQAGNIAAIGLPDERLRFGLGAAAFGQSPELAIQKLGECALIEGIPWWTSAEQPGTSQREEGTAEMLTPFLFAWDGLDSAWASLTSSCSLPLVEWYEQLMEHPAIRKTGAIAIEVVAQVPAEAIVDKYMCYAPLAQTNTLRAGQLITDLDLIDTYFLRDTIRHTVPLDTICTLVMVGIVVDPIVVAAKWGNNILERGFYVTPGIGSHANVIHHTHAAVILDSCSMYTNHYNAATSIDTEISMTAQELTSVPHKVAVVHIENDTRLRQAIARIGIIETIKTWF